MREGRKVVMCGCHRMAGRPAPVSIRVAERVRQYMNTGSVRRHRIRPPSNFFVTNGGRLSRKKTHFVAELSSASKR